MTHSHSLTGEKCVIYGYNSRTRARSRFRSLQQVLDSSATCHLGLPGKFQACWGSGEVDHWKNSLCLCEERRPSFEFSLCHFGVGGWLRGRLMFGPWSEAIKFRLPGMHAKLARLSGLAELTHCSSVEKKTLHSGRRVDGLPRASDNQLWANEWILRASSENNYSGRQQWCHFLPFFRSSLSCFF